MLQYYSICHMFIVIKKSFNNSTAASSRMRIAPKLLDLATPCLNVLNKEYKVECKF